MTLSDTKLLEVCVRGTTQNPNECINCMVWVHCPKHKLHGAKVIRCAAASAVCHFHQGAECRKTIMEKLSIPSGTYTSHAFNLKDRKHLQNADLQVTEKEKKRHHGLQFVHTRREEALCEMEGVTYESGAF